MRPKYEVIFSRSYFPTRKSFWEKMHISTINERPTLVRLLSWVKTAVLRYETGSISLSDLEDFFELIHFDVVLKTVGDKIWIDYRIKQGYVEELTKLSDLTDSIVRYGFNADNQESAHILLERFAKEIEALESGSSPAASTLMKIEGT